MERIREIEEQDSSCQNEIYFLEAPNGLKESIRRIKKQEACFTFHTKNFKCMKTQHFTDLRGIVIDKDIKPYILQELKGEKIDNVSLFPDLDGLCKHLMLELQINQKIAENDNVRFLEKQLENAKGSDD